ncbi:CDP-alcohol phosphatidyltransferase family protein [Candidatus Bathyarchaeota archaeon]|nr:CDP-alcohol phosphatidyltransferase family protein [Candidatus Bathyarchaeota archaeon]
MSLERIKEEARRTALKRNYPYRIFFLSRISPYITYLFTKTSITPNQVTLLSFLFVLLSVILLSRPEPLNWIFGWLLLQAYLILDCSDGELARIKGMETRFGAFLDNFLHPISNSLVVMGAGTGCYRAYHTPPLLLLTSGAAVITMALSLSRSNILLLVKGREVQAKKGGGHPLVRLALSPGGFFHPLLALSIVEMMAPKVPVRIIYIPSVLLIGLCLLVKRIFRFYRGERRRC